MNRKLTYIGYYNAHEYPVAFSRRSDGSGIMLDPGQPVTQDSKLVPFPNDELESHVSRGALSRIEEHNAAFKDWDKLVEQRKSATVIPLNRKGDPQLAEAHNKVRRPKQVVHDEAKATISSKNGVQLNNDAAKERLAERGRKPITSIQLPDGVEDLGNGTYKYANQTFESVSALLMFIDMSKSAPVVR